MQISVISDTHEQHEALGTLAGDVLIHCGDFANGFSRTDDQIAALDDWFGRQAFGCILVVGGNHDFALEEHAARGMMPFRNAVHLRDASVDYHGVRFHGAPWVPELESWAFYQSPEELARSWARIPGDTDVLITHTPPFGILDRNSRGKHCGCPLLRDELSRIAPRAHCFGHIHASSGMLVQDRIRFVNASMVNSSYEMVRSPYRFDM